MRSGAQAAAAVVRLVAVTASFWLLIPHMCTLGWRLAIELPGCNWEYVAPPDAAGALTMWILAGAVFQVVTLGLPLITAAVVAGAARAAWVRRRKAVAVRP
jgi:L-arabinose isomerase